MGYKFLGIMKVFLNGLMVNINLFGSQSILTKGHTVFADLGLFLERFWHSLSAIMATWLAQAALMAKSYKIVGIIPAFLKKPIPIALASFALAIVWIAFSRSAKKKQVACRPVLVAQYIREGRLLKVVNEGSGPATNICLIVWQDLTLSATLRHDLPYIRNASKESHTFPIDKCMPITFAKLQERFPGLTEFSVFIKRITAASSQLMCLVYRDLEGEWFYSILSGIDEPNYGKLFEYGSLK